MRQKHAIGSASFQQDVPLIPESEEFFCGLDSFNNHRCLPRLCPTKRGTNHKRHNEEHKKHKKRFLCAFCGCVLPFVYLPRFLGQSAFMLNLLRGRESVAPYTQPPPARHPGGLESRERDGGETPHATRNGGCRDRRDSKIQWSQYLGRPARRLLSACP